MNSTSANKAGSYGAINNDAIEINQDQEELDEDDISDVTVSMSSRLTSASLGLIVTAIFMGGLMMIATASKSGYFKSTEAWVTTNLLTTLSATSTTLTSGTILPTQTTNTVPSTGSLPLSGSSSSLPGASAVTSAPSTTPAPSTKTRAPTKKVKSPTVAPTTTTVSDTDDAELSKQPNFIVIVADDLAWNSLGYTNSDYEEYTPNLSDLASNGIIMDNYYAQEVCSPSRGSLLTGRYPLSIGMQYGMVSANAEWGMPLDEVTLAEVLSDSGYKTHMLGKWHIGYFSPLFLPTARGFDSWIGYANGENYYWSKKSPDYPEFTDFIESDTSCYKAYNGSDKHDYSTTFYTNHALKIIDEHDKSDPMFLYLAYQAVHDPFVDYGIHKWGMPDEYLDDDVRESIEKNVVGSMRKQYVKSLNVLDKGVGQIKTKLEEKGMMDNTYIIFMSDNGGCFYGGGKNGPLRGSKGALFEGGIKVDSFIYGPKLSNPGSTYSGLMHVSDWFPTMLALASISYEADSDHPLDGVNQIDGWKGSKTPRANMLYNMYLALTDYDFNIWTNGSFAVRDSRFKLMHTYDDSIYGATYNVDSEIDGDDDLDSDDRCAQQFANGGDFTYFLYDLTNDPHETTNLYDSEESIYTMAKEKLYTLLPGYMQRATTKIAIQWSDKAEKVWQSSDSNILPWADTDTLENSGSSDYPSYCPDGSVDVAEGR